MGDLCLFPLPWDTWSCEHHRELPLPPLREWTHWWAAKGDGHRLGRNHSPQELKRIERTNPFPHFGGRDAQPHEASLPSWACMEPAAGRALELSPPKEQSELAQLPLEWGVTILEVSMNSAGVALGHMVSGHGGVCWGWAWRSGRSFPTWMMWWFYDSKESRVLIFSTAILLSCLPFVIPCLSISFRLRRHSWAVKCLLLP